MNGQVDREAVVLHDGTFLLRVETFLTHRGLAPLPATLGRAGELSWSDATRDKALQRL